MKDKVQLEISRIIHGYVNILPINSTSSASLSCHNNIACFQAWDDESDAVAKLIMGTGLCSGSLQNNTANDYRAFLLTAFHCVDSDHDGDYDGNDYNVDDYVFHFHYKSPTCVGTSASYIEYNSSSYRAGWSNSDFALIEVDDSPVGNGNIAFLGWENRANTPTSGVCIHHPAGDIMKISFDNNSLTTNNHIIDWDFGPDSPALTHWVSTLDSGTTEGGSSGGPLFDQNSRVVGQVHGGFNSCPPVTKYFGRFDVSWNGNSTTTTQLAHWLDPNNTQDPTTDLLRSPSLVVPDVICYSGNTVSILNPPGVTITWDGTNVTYPYGNTGTSVFVRATNSTTSANGTVTASFSVNGISRTITHPVWAGKPQIYSYGSHIVDVNTGMPVYDLCYGTHNDVEAVHPAGDASITDWDWQVSYGQVYPYGMLDQYATIYPYDYQSFMLEIRACNTCGYTDWKHMYINVENCGLYLLVFTPNPTSGETTLSIESESNEKTFDETAEWELEIYDNAQMLKEKKTKLKGNNTKIQTAGWKEGMYVVRVKYKNQILTGKLVVKK
ncbi:MAG: T9SS type A sorting domain-containing protein [Draconibacterium sp.]